MWRRTGRPHTDHIAIASWRLERAGTRRHPAAALGTGTDGAAGEMRLGESPRVQVVTEVHRVESLRVEGATDPLDSLVRGPRRCQDERSREHFGGGMRGWAVSYTHLRAHETDSYLVCRLLLEKKKKKD